MAIKVRASVSLEDRLSGLQLDRPLNLRTDVDVHLDSPVLDANPLDSDRSASGKFARCNNHGALLKSKPKSLIAIIPDNAPYWSSGSGVQSATFSRRVKFVVGMVYILFGGDELWWLDSSGAILTTYTEVDTYTIPFSGRTIWFNRSSSGIPVGISLVGFYES